MKSKGYLAKKVVGTAFNAALKNPIVKQNVESRHFDKLAGAY